MSIPENITNKKGISAILLIALTGAGLGGNSLYNDSNQEESDINLIEQISNSILFKHTAQAIPHPVTEVKLEMVSKYIDMDMQFKTDIMQKIDENHDEIIQKIDENHEKSKCRDQQLKDLIYKIDESVC